MAKFCAQKRLGQAKHSGKCGSERIKSWMVGTQVWTKSCLNPSFNTRMKRQPFSFEISLPFIKCAGQQNFSRTKTSSSCLFLLVEPFNFSRWTHLSITFSKLWWLKNTTSGKWKTSMGLREQETCKIQRNRTLSIWISQSWAEISAELIKRSFQVACWQHVTD